LGVGAHGIYADNEFGGLISISSYGNIKTVGDGAVGIYGSTGYRTVTIVSHGDVATNGVAAYGLYATNGAGNNDTASGQAAASITSVGDVTTTGIGAIGIFAESKFDPTVSASLSTSVDIASTGNVLVSGKDADAIRGSSIGGNIDISILGGSVSGGLGSGAGVRFVGGKNNLLTNFGILTDVAGISGTAISGDTGNNSIDNAGTITGNVDLGTGSNAFYNRNGAIFDAGNIVSLGTGNTLTNFGTLSPGGAGVIQATALTGNLVFGAGSVYLVDVSPTLGDRTNVSGMLTLLGGTVQVVAAPGEYSPATRYTILTANGGVTGTFSALTTSANLAFLNPFILYDPNDVVLGFQRNGNGFPSVGSTPNQVATGAAIESLGSSSPLFSAAVGLTAPQARNAFDLASGEIHASAVSAAFEDGRLPREAILDRLWAPYGSLSSSAPRTEPGDAGLMATTTPAPIGTAADNYSAWGEAFGAFGHVGGDGNAASLDRSLTGFIGGIDIDPAPHSRVGVAIGYTHSWLSVDPRASSGSIDSVLAGLYGGRDFGALHMRGGVSAAANNYATSRTIAIPGFFDETTSKDGGDTLQAFGETGWRFTSGFTSVEPFVGGLAMHIDTGSFTEKGGPAALQGLPRSYEFGATTLGVRTEIELFAGLPLLARGMMGWQHNFGNVTPTSMVAFVSTPSNPFEIGGAPIARESLVAEAGLDWHLTNAATIGLFYSSQFGSRDQDNSIKGELEVAF
jgi:uncharacterized protein with beta-barrel porin domain